jgi:hypothetical protein
MSIDIAGAADMITGGVIARAVEPQAGEGAQGQPPAGSNCLNCGAALAGQHCHGCGQKSHVHRTLHEFGHDFLHSVLHFDGKIWRTLPMLFWRPGDLTRRYIHGERAKFVSPLALFLFSVFLTFAAFNSLVPASLGANGLAGGDTAQQAYESDRNEILVDIAELQADKKEAIAGGESGYEWMDGAIARHRASLQSLEEDRGKKIKHADIAARKFALEKVKLETQVSRLESEISAATKAGKPTGALMEQLESERVGIEMLRNAAGALTGNGVTVVSDDANKNWTFTDPNFPGAAKLNAAFKHARENPQLLLYKIQSNAYKYSWALIPISVPFLWLLFFWRRQFKLFDHAVFVTYSLTFMMLLGTVSAFLMQFSATEVVGGLAMSFLPPIHMYRQLHHAYGTSRFGAFWRMCLLSLFALTALTLFAVLIVTLGVTG